VSNVSAFLPLSSSVSKQVRVRERIKSSSHTSTRVEKELVILLLSLLLCRRVEICEVIEEAMPDGASKTKWVLDLV